MSDLEFAEQRHWWADSRCTPADDGAFFGGAGQAGAQAKLICAECPVRTMCLADAISTETPEWGIFGGFGRQMRRRLSRLVRAGQSPLTVAAAAIDEETRRLEANRKESHDPIARALATSARRQRTRGRSGDRLQPHPA